MKRTLILIAVLLLLVGGGVYIRRVIHETVESPKAGQHYLVALGDSVAAGAGLSNNRGGSGQGCDVSDSAFPFVLSKQLHEPIEQFACSGATVAAEKAGATNTLVAQYTMAKPFLAGSDVVVQAGANDIGWLQLLTSCTQTNCATDANRTVIATKLQLMQKNLTDLLVRLQQSKPRHLLVNTYYGLLAPGDACVARYGISPEEVSFIVDEEGQLNATITAAATQAKATTVAVDFSGHLLCSNDSWIQNVTASAPLHPTAAGQQHIASQDSQALSAAR